MDDYMTWYRRIKRLLISGTSRRGAPSRYQSAHTGLLLGRVMVDVYDKVIRTTQTASDLPQDRGYPLAMDSLSNIGSIIHDTLSSVGQSHLLQGLSAEMPRARTSSSTPRIEIDASSSSTCTPHPSPQIIGHGGLDTILEDNELSPSSDLALHRKRQHMS